MADAGVAENSRGESGVEEEFTYFFCDEADVKPLCCDATEYGDEHEDELPEGGLRVEECLFKCGKVAPAAQGGYAE